MHKQFILATTALAGTLVALPQATYAQDAAAPAARAGLEDIVVTARKVEENIQTTPVAVTALGAEAIERNQIINIADAQRTTPSLTIARGSARSEEHTSELQSLMRISYAVFCFKKKK